MSKIAVIYCSKTGFSARYARWVARDLHADLYRYKTVDTALLAPYQVIIYGAGFYAGKLKGARWFMRTVRPLSSAHIIVFATGSMLMSIPEIYNGSGICLFDSGNKNRSIFSICPAA